MARDFFAMTPFADLRRDIDRMIDGYSNLLGTPFRRLMSYPPVNVWDEGEALMVEAEIPGIRQEDLEIFAVRNELTLRGRRMAEAENAVYHRQERGTGEFTRVITLPVEVNSDKIEAQLRDGVLTVRLPKAESARPRKIAVKTS